MLKLSRGCTHDFRDSVVDTVSHISLCISLDAEPSSHTIHSTGHNLRSALGAVFLNFQVSAEYFCHHREKLPTLQRQSVAATPRLTLHIAAILHETIRTFAMFAS